MLKLHSISRDNLYDAQANYDNGEVTVLRGSKINMKQSSKFHPSEEILTKRNDKTIIGTNGILKKDVSFSSLSSAATFVTGRISNGLIMWKTEDGKYVRYTLKPQDKNK